MPASVFNLIFLTKSCCKQESDKLTYYLPPLWCPKQTTKKKKNQIFVSRKWYDRAIFWYVFASCHIFMLYILCIHQVLLYSDHCLHAAANFVPQYSACLCWGMHHVVRVPWSLDITATAFFFGSHFYAVRIWRKIICCKFILMSAIQPTGIIHH